MNRHYHKVCEFIEANYADVLDYGLMDDVLANEYKAGVGMLSCDEMSVEEREHLCGWLDVVISQMVECAKDNITVGRRHPVFERFLKRVDV